MKIRLSYALFLAALLLAIAFDVLFYGARELGVNMPIAELLFVAVSISLAQAQKVKITHGAKVAAGFAVAFSTTFAIWTSEWSLQMCLLGFLVANALFAIFLLGESARFRHPIDVLGGLIIVPIQHALFALPFVKTLLPERFSPRTQKTIQAIAIALPILLVFTLLFSAADAIFRSYIVDAFQALTGWFSVPNAVGHVIFIGVFLVLFVFFFAAAFWNKKIFAKKSADASARAIFESKIILVGVAILFAVFLFISGSALFGGSSELARLGITYSDYARQGFGQLCAASALVIGLILTLRVLHTENADKKLLALHVTLLVEAALVLVSAFMRLGLYTNAYGYTPARLFGFWFFALIALFLALTFANVIARKHQSSLVTQMLVTSGIAILVFTVLTPDALSVRLNAARATTEQPLVFNKHELRDLSAEAFPSIISAYITSSQPDSENFLSPAPSVADYCSALIGKNLHEMTDAEKHIHADYSARSSVYNFLTSSFIDEKWVPRWQSWNLARSTAKNTQRVLPSWLDNFRTFNANFSLNSRGLGQNPSCITSVQTP